MLKTPNILSILKRKLEAAFSTPVTNKGRERAKTPNTLSLGYRVIGDFPSKIFPLFLTSFIKRSLSRAKLRLSHIVYISSMVFWSILATILAVAVSFPITTALNLLLGLPFSPLLLTFGAAAGVGAIVFALFLFYPHIVLGHIKSGIDKNIVYIINYMSILAGAGVIPEDIFTSLAKTGDTYELEVSAKSVVRDIELLGKDIITAIAEESKSTPSKEYSKLLQGLTGTIRTGGDLKDYLKETAEHQMEVRRRKLSKIVSQLNLAAEAYIVLGVAFPIILTTLLSMMGMFGGEIIGGLGPSQIMSLMTYLFFPLASIGVLILIDAVTGSW